MLCLLLLLLTAARAELYEGDIYITEQEPQSSSGFLGVRLADPTRMWPNGQVPYKYER